MQSEILYMKSTPADLLPDGIVRSYPHVALFKDKFCTDGQMQLMVDFGKDLSLCDDVMSAAIDDVKYRAFCFADGYEATCFAIAFDAQHFDTGHGPAIRLDC